ncbi:hypothetical protein COU20_01920 [Candidatus Kaiserbacteria bacterium CG10_big_fil_rev_8_21_14_0_10_59_10]|uniref:PrgI family protein n=1 Tax=Candidatus Kaiserbacteria bacterium CG10_big_fil_rev_8_21_14_0_10_59_10 TaxID=1974612 RepID=A0A2H0U9T6_9BACT|nr:MAG: hypothetical protein COU20_01920 [Candidatus Kaiserbacteria bacterium CG10_big_fil_rev_8_21_14_0_10_59_10]
MQFQVPQFIEVEDKIFGPLTFKQFVYVAGGLGAAYLSWRVLPIYIAAPVVLSLAGLGVALAFLNINGRPFIAALESGFYYVMRSKLYLWNNERRSRLEKPKTVSADAMKVADVYIPKLSDSRLHELAWSLDIKERVAQGTATAEDREEALPAHALVAPVRESREGRVRQLAGSS